MPDPGPVPDPVVMNRSLGEPDQAVLFLETVDTEEPTSVLLTLVPGVLPGVDLIREEILVTWLTLEIMPARQ